MVFLMRKVFTAKATKKNAEIAEIFNRCFCLPLSWCRTTERGAPPDTTMRIRCPHSNPQDSNILIFQRPANKTSHMFSIFPAGAILQILPCFPKAFICPGGQGTNCKFAPAGVIFSQPVLRLNLVLFNFTLILFSIKLFLDVYFIKKKEQIFYFLFIQGNV